LLARILNHVNRKPNPIPERPELAKTLLWAAECGETETIFQLLDKGAPINAQNPSGLGALHFLISNGQSDAAITFIARGADVSAVTTEGIAPIHSAAMYGKNRIIDALIQADADINARTASGFTALHFANRGGVARRLIQAGIDISIKSRDGQSALDIAHKAGRRDVEAAILNAISLRNTALLKRVVTLKGRK